MAKQAALSCLQTAAKLTPLSCFQKALDKAHKHITLPGACTACMVSIASDGQSACALNLVSALSSFQTRRHGRLSAFMLADNDLKQGAYGFTDP